MTKNEILLNIAIGRLNMKTLEGEDFHQFSTSHIKRALNEAFEWGRQCQLDIINGDIQESDL